MPLARAMLLLLCALPATSVCSVEAVLADEEPRPLAPDPDTPETAAPKPMQVAFGLEHVVPLAGVRPDGWRDGAGTMPEGVPTAEVLLAIARDAGIEASKANARCLPLIKGEGDTAAKGMVAWVAIDMEDQTFTPRLQEAARQHGWLLRNLGVPQRVMVTWGSDEASAEAIQTWQTEHAVRSLCEKGWALLGAAGQEFDRVERQRMLVHAQAMIRIAGATLPDAALYHAMMGALLQQQDASAALEHHRRAFKKDAPIPLTDEWTVQAAFHGGQGLLLKMDDAVLEEARSILERGIQAEQGAAAVFMRFGNRYNLACTHARLGNEDKAFEHLEESLRYLKAEWEEEKKTSFSGMSQLQYPKHFEHAKQVDTDLAPLRKDPRWTALMEKYDPDPPPPKAPDADDEGGDEDK